MCFFFVCDQQVVVKLVLEHVFLFLDCELHVKDAERLFGSGVAKL